jgi:hypothetical protein
MMINILHCPLLSIWASGNHLFFSRSPIVTRALFRSAPTADTLLRCNSTEYGSNFTVMLNECEGHRAPLWRDGLVHNYRVTLPHDHQVAINLCAEDDEVYASSIVTIFPCGRDGQDDILSVSRRTCTQDGWR